MSRVKSIINQAQAGQRILLSFGVLAITGSLMMGFDDNMSGVILMVVAITCAVGICVWKWYMPRKFWIMFGIAFLFLLTRVVMHISLSLLGTIISENNIIEWPSGSLEPISITLTTLIVGSVAVVALVGGIKSSWRGLEGLTNQNRSFRRFEQYYKISYKQLVGFVRLARRSASLANLQPLKYILSHTEKSNQIIFQTLSWAGYINDWDGPEEGEKPSAFIILLGDTTIAKSFQYDAGIACQSITLGATEKGLGACIIGSIKRETLRENLSIAKKYEILLVIALGKPAETVVLEKMGENRDVKYWRDENDLHHVPKRDLGELIIN